MLQQTRVALLIFCIMGLCAGLFVEKSQADIWKPVGNLEQVRLWPSGAPDRDKGNEKPETVKVNESKPGEPLRSTAFDVSDPTITVYPAKGVNTGAAIVVFPGGGYRVLAMEYEGTEVCDWLVPHGVTCVVLKYRVPFSGPAWDPECKCRVVPKTFTALQDAQRAMGLVRFNASKWKIDPKKIGVIGFSAGGHLVAALSTNYQKRIYPQTDDADKVSCRPDFAIDLYGGHMTIGHYDAKAKEDLTKLSPGIPVTSDTPPTFLVHAVDDPVDPVEFSILYFSALKKARVPVEMHLYAEGGHAFAFCRKDLPVCDWPKAAEAWMRNLSFLSKK